MKLSVLVATALVLLLPLARADVSPVGKQFWLASNPEASTLDRVRERLIQSAIDRVKSRAADGHNAGLSYAHLKQAMGDAKWLRVISDAQGDHYDVELSSGEPSIIPKHLVEAGIKEGILLPYDPEAKAHREAAAAEVERIKRIKSNKWPATMERAIIDRKVQIGMTAEQVTMSWGKPERNNRSVGLWGVHEQWIYGDTYLYFQNGVLTSYQDRR